MVSKNNPKMVDSRLTALQVNVVLLDSSRPNPRRSMTNALIVIIVRGKILRLELG